MTHLLVIGGASSDILHFAGQKIASAGGAGMYTAMAAQRCGVQVSMFGPRPVSCPERLQPVAEHLKEWLGPVFSPGQLPQFEISYEQGKTEYLKKSLGAELLLSPTDLPADLSKYDLVHLTPLGDVVNQLAFIQACRQRGVKKISAGTGLFNVEEQPQAVRAVLEESDYFFMNNLEAEAVFGSLESAKTKPGKVLFVTLGEKGALVILGNFVTELQTAPCKVLDPTGAGDTFCGATNAQLIKGNHPVMAARSAMSLAAQMIEHPGPTALLWPDPPPDAPWDQRAVVNESQVQKVSQLIAELPEVSPFDFTAPENPPVGHPLALDWFFVSTLQQFSFWTTDNGRYHQPLIASIDGVELKGSDYLWQGYLRSLEDDPEFFTPQRQANHTQTEMENLFRADDGTVPMPALELHLAQARQYGQDMLTLKLTPHEVVRQAQASAKPLKTFFELLDHIGGYKEDPLRKKPGLLALILNQRPEVFFPIEEDERVTPVIDYHEMRACLRVGLVDVVDGKLWEKLVNRQVLMPDEEWAVRYAAYIAIEQVADISGKSAGAVDWFFFNSRKRCPEMTEPICEECQIDPICAHQKELFQPVMRTTFY
jgi:sugar/nucleoside kinase (ribokinase family)